MCNYTSNTHNKLGSNKLDEKTASSTERKP